MIELSDVCKIYNNGTNALKNINLNIDAGEFIFIVGPSGSGKTTLLKLLTREEKATKGDIMVGEFFLSDMMRFEIPYLRRHIGVVFQDFRLLEKKTVYENVAFAMIATGRSQRLIKRNVPAVLDLVGLSNKHKAYPSQLSGGEQQRTAIARAIVNNPAVLIADEPTGNIDPDTSIEIMELFNEINKHGTTIVVATHDKTIVDIFKKRVIRIEDGVLISDIMKGKY